MTYKSLAYFRGTMVHSEEFTADGTWTKPDNVDYIDVMLVAGGGGGGADGSGGSGGGGGEIKIRQRLKVTGDVSVTIGSGGNGGVYGGSAASNGGNSTLSGGVSLTAYGGEGAPDSCIGGMGGGAADNSPYAIGQGGHNGANNSHHGADSWGTLGGQPGGGGGAGGGNATDGNAGDGGPCIGFGLGGSRGSVSDGGGGGGSYDAGGDGGSGSSDPDAAGDSATGYGGGGGGADYHSDGGDGAPGYCLITWVV